MLEVMSDARIAEAARGPEGAVYSTARSTGETEWRTLQGGCWRYFDLIWFFFFLIFRLGWLQLIGIAIKARIGTISWFLVRYITDQRNWRLRFKKQEWTIFQRCHAKLRFLVLLIETKFHLHELSDLSFDRRWIFVLMKRTRNRNKVQWSFCFCSLQYSIQAANSKLNLSINRADILGTCYSCPLLENNTADKLDCLQSYIFPYNRHDRELRNGRHQLFILRAQPEERTTIHRGGGGGCPTLHNIRHLGGLLSSPLQVLGLRSQYKQRWRPFRSSRVIVAILPKNRGP